MCSVGEKGHEKLLFEIKGLDSTNYKLRSLVWVNFPLAYTQVVILVSWTLYFLIFVSTLYIEEKNTDVTTKIVTILYRFLEFIFYLGWLHVAKIMLNPFGEDDNDIDVNYIIDRNLSTSFLIVNGNSGDFPGYPIDTYEGMKIPISALGYDHNECGPLTVNKILEAAGVAKSGR